MIRGRWPHLWVSSPELTFTYSLPLSPVWIEFGFANVPKNQFLTQLAVICNDFGILLLSSSTPSSSSSSSSSHSLIRFELKPGDLDIIISNNSILIILIVITITKVLRLLVEGVYRQGHHHHHLLLHHHQSGQGQDIGYLVAAWAKNAGRFGYQGHIHYLSIRCLPRPKHLQLQCNWCDPQCYPVWSKWCCNVLTWIWKRWGC